MTKRKTDIKGRVKASEIMLWSETHEEYEALRAGAYQEWCPEGVTEEFEVNTLVQLLWRRRRFDRYEQIGTQKRLDHIRHGNEQSRHIANLKAFAPEFNAADTVEKVNAVLAQLSPLYRNTIHRDLPLKDGDDPCKWGSSIAIALSAWKAPARHEDADEFLATIDVEEMFDRNLVRIERMDAMIDRAIKRLVQIKAMKQMHGQLQPKLVNGTIQAVNNTAIKISPPIEG